MFWQYFLLIRKWGIKGLEQTQRGICFERAHGEKVTSILSQINSHCLYENSCSSGTVDALSKVWHKNTGQKRVLIDQDSINRIATVWVLVYCHPQVIKTAVLQVSKIAYFNMYFCLYFKNVFESSTLSYSKLIQNIGGEKDFSYLVDTKSAQKRHFQPGVLLFVFPPLPFVVVVLLQMEAE